MALKKARIHQISNNDREVKNNMDNVKKYEDSFFETQKLNYGNMLPTDLEIELEEEKLIPKGKYEFIVKNLSMENQVPTKYGIKNRICIQYHISNTLNAENSTFDLSQKYNLSSNINSNFYKMYKELTGVAPKGRINLRNLLGIKGECEIKHICMDGGNIFYKIVNLKPDIEKNEALETV